MNSHQKYKILFLKYAVYSDPQTSMVNGSFVNKHMFDAKKSAHPPKILLSTHGEVPYVVEKTTKNRQTYYVLCPKKAHVGRNHC